MKKIKTVGCCVVKQDGWPNSSLDKIHYTSSLDTDISMTFPIGERVIIVSKSDYESLVANQKKPKINYGI